MAGRRRRRRRGAFGCGWVVAAVGIALLAAYCAPRAEPPPEAPPAPCADLATDCARRVRGAACTTHALLESCPATCGLCAEGCRRLNATPSVSAGGLVPLFERMATAERYSPRWLSRDPPVLAFDTFLDAEDAAHMRAHCQAYERSLAGDAVSEKRTSQQCWCHTPECLADQRIQRVLHRVHALTETHPDIAEYLQLVRYEEGQFYQVHHDQNASPLAPQGPRTLTFFMYLNTPDAGGATRFPDLDLEVEAVEGRAVVWSSVLDGAPKEADARTRHEALPVVRGVKYGANLWFHLFDWKGTARRGCPLLHHQTLG